MQISILAPIFDMSQNVVFGSWLAQFCQLQQHFSCHHTMLLALFSISLNVFFFFFFIFTKKKFNNYLHTLFISCIYRLASLYHCRISCIVYIDRYSFYVLTEMNNISFVLVFVIDSHKSGFENIISGGVSL